MEIYYLKNKCFRFKNRSVSVLINPKEGTEADIIVVTSHTESSLNEKDYKCGKLIYGPGEYEIGGVSFIISRTKEGIFTLIEMDDLRICYLGDYDGVFGESEINQVGDIDVLVSPLKKDLVEKIEPYFVVLGSDTSQELLKDIGMTVETTQKFTVKKDEILDDQPAKVVLLEPR